MKYKNSPQTYNNHTFNTTDGEGIENATYGIQESGYGPGKVSVSTIKGSDCPDKGKVQWIYKGI